MQALGGVEGDAADMGCRRVRDKKNKKKTTASQIVNMTDRLR